MAVSIKPAALSINARHAAPSLTQTVSVSNDNGQTWSTGFAGVYVRTGRTTPTRDPDATYPYNDALGRPSGGRPGGGAP